MRNTAAMDRPDGAAPSTDRDLDPALEEHRRELTGYCYRMLGSSFEAEDAVQETMVRAWRNLDSFEGRSSLRSWLYRIATNVCLDMLRGRRRRALPVDVSPAATPESTLVTRSGRAWIEPVPDSEVLPTEGDPADLAVQRQSIRLAFVAALQHLPPRQRAVLILRDVLAWHANEVADLLGTTVVSVNSALQRARATMAASDLDEAARQPVVADDEQDLLRRYVDAFEQYDIDSLVALLHADATMSMPPYRLWLRGPAHIGEWFVGQGHECRGSRLMPVSANGSWAFGQYRPSGPGGRHEPWSIQVLDVTPEGISGIISFLDTNLFPVFGLPARLEPGDAVNPG